MPPLVSVSLAASEGSSDFEDAEKHNLKSKHARQCRDSQSEGMGESAMTKTKSNKPNQSDRPVVRRTGVNKSAPNYDTKLYPMDRYLIPTSNARRLDHTAESISPSQLQPVQHAVNSRLKHDALISNPAVSSSNRMEEEALAPTTYRLADDMRPSSISPAKRKSNPQASRHSSRIAAQKFVNYSQNIHPQDEFIPGYNRRTVRSQRGKNPSDGLRNHQSKAAREEEEQTGTLQSLLLAQDKARWREKRRAAGAMSKTPPDHGADDSDDAFAIEESPQAVASLPEAFQSISSVDTVPMEPSNNVASSDDEADIPLSSRYKSSQQRREQPPQEQLELQSVAATVLAMDQVISLEDLVGRMSQQMRDGLLEVLLQHKYQTAQTIECGTQESHDDSKDSLARFRMFKVSSDTPSAGAETHCLHASPCHEHNVPASLQQLHDDDSTTLNGSTTLSGDSLMCDTYVQTIHEEIPSYGHENSELSSNGTCAGFPTL